MTGCKFSQLLPLLLLLRRRSWPSPGLSVCVAQERHALSESGVYYVPPDGPLSSYLAYVDFLPLVQQPEAFGLHMNADISKDLNQVSSSGSNSSM